MKLEAIKSGLTISSAFALALAGCDTSSGDDTAGVDTMAADTEEGGMDDVESDSSSTTEGDETPADTTVGADDDETGTLPGEGVDPPTFDCDAATGTLVDKFFRIDSGEFNEIEKLEGIGIVDGNVEINESNYNNLDFLNCVTEITGDLTIFGNPFLIDITATNNLQTLGGDFVFTANDSMTVFDGMNSVTEIARSMNPEPPPTELFHSLVMNKNAALTRVEGWENLELIFGNLTIRDNPVLENIDGLKGIVGIGQVLSVRDNPALCLSSINCVGGGILSPAPEDIPDTWNTTANNPDC